MTKNRTIQIYRGTTAQNNSYTGSAGELTMDTTTNELRLHDGSTAGGHIIGSGSEGHEVIEFQAPTAENNYTWYRKYADGWVEQVGRVLSTTIGYQVTLPITMSNTNYTAITTGTSSVNSQPSDTNWANRNTAFNYSRIVYDIRTTGFKVGNEGEMSQNGFCWQVSGMAEN